MQLDFTLVWILAGFGLLVSISLLFWSLRRYEVAVLLVVLSPWISAFNFGASDITVDEEPGIRSYIRVGVLLLMGLVGIVTFFNSRSEKREKIPFDFALLGAFVLLALVSTGYSIDMRYSFVRSISFATLFAFLLGLHYWLTGEYQFDRVLGILFGFVLFCTFLNLASMAFLPKLTWALAENRFQGLWDHPNTMGAFCMLSYPVCLWKYSRASTMGKCMVLGTIIALAIMHFLTGSRSSLICAVFGIALWLFIRKGKSKSVFFVVGIGLLIVLMGSIIQVKLPYFERESGDDITTLNERTEFWSGAYILLMERAVHGYGYEVEGKVYKDPRFHNPEIKAWSGSARVPLHNGYLSVAIGLGIVGFSLWCVILFLPFRRSLHSYSSDHKAFVISIMSMALLLNFVEAAIGSGSSITAVFYWIAWVMAERLPLGETEKGLTDEAVEELPWRRFQRSRHIGGL